jgi:hypothetical protein
MTKIKRIVCLANSRKPGGRCIAGKVVSEGLVGCWIRPVSDRQREEVSSSERRYEDGNEPHVLDIIDVPVLTPRPHTYQKENWLLDPTAYWKKVGSMTWSAATESIDPDERLWGANDSTHDGLNDRIALSMAQDLTSSLRLIRLDHLTLVVLKTGEAFGNPRLRLQGRFQHLGVEYWLWVTVVEYEERYLANGEGKYEIGECLITVSISEPYEGACYKVIAAVIERTPER